MGHQMGLFGHRQAWCAAIFACGLAWFGPITGSGAGTLDSPRAPETAVPSAEPFGLATFPVYAGGLHDKWQGVAHKLDDERVQLALCDGDRDDCASTAALQFLAIVDSGRARAGRARLGEINRAINLAIHPMSDLAQYGEIDVWSSPLVTFYRGAGDCEDYAIAKYVALLEAGIAANDLRIVILRDTLSGEDHAVAAVRLDGHWLMLDNRRMAMVEDAYVRNYQPLFVIGPSGPMRYVGPPLLANLPDHGSMSATAASDSLVQPGLIGAAN
jgi:predicted transglutaminase-like cysteine proteinase